MGRFLALLLVFPAAGFAAEIPSGTHVLLRMVNSLNTRTAKEGDQVYMQTATPVALNGAIVIPVGSYVQGTVSLARRGGRVSGRAELALHLDTLTLPGGKALRFAPRVAAADPGETSQKVDGAENTIRQGSNVGQDAARIAVLAGTGASIGGLTDQGWKGAGIGAAAGGAVGFATTLMSRGREVELRAGSTLDVVFDRALDVE